MRGLPAGLHSAVWLISSWQWQSSSFHVGFAATQMLERLGLVTLLAMLQGRRCARWGGTTPLWTTCARRYACRQRAKRCEACCTVSGVIQLVAGAVVPDLHGIHIIAEAAALFPLLPPART